MFLFHIDSFSYRSVFFFMFSNRKHVFGMLFCLTKLSSYAQSIKKTIGCSVEIIKRSELHKFVVLPKRWIVERTFAWLENYRRLWKNCERTLENSRQSCLLAGVAILLKRF
ncbi:hypothetical protein BT246_31570 [Bacillus thuringiensis]|uniref:Transposase IS4-like domain-containing protein n=1 Tax=Bacillus thuringiensis TaxID=1428 RepID=A0A9W3SC60_BACTU|nr:hypothetical protein BT246_31570 [Bacillus thuringiensis]